MKIPSRRFIIPVYIIFLLVAFFYVKSVLKEGDFKVNEKNNPEQGFEVKPAVAYLDIEFPSFTKEYRVRMKNIDSIVDMLEELRKEGLTYEVIAYTYGTEFEHFNKYYPPEGKAWRIFKGEEDITFEVGNLHLEDNQKYVFRLVEN